MLLNQPSNFKLQSKLKDLLDQNGGAPHFSTVRSRLIPIFTLNPSLQFLI